MTLYVPTVPIGFLSLFCPAHGEADGIFQGKTFVVFPTTAHPQLFFFF